MKDSNKSILWFIAAILATTFILAIFVDTGIAVWAAAALIVGFFFQNMVFTMVSRSRNSGHVWFHFPIAIMSNGIYFLLHYIFILPQLIQQIAEGSTEGMLWLGVLYTLPTASGSTLMMWIAINKIEKGKKRVGGNSFNEMEAKIKTLENTMHMANENTAKLIAANGELAHRIAALEKPKPRRRKNG